jgi:hypothetical protein
LVPELVNVSEISFSSVANRTSRHRSLWHLASPVASVMTVATCVIPVVATALLGRLLYHGHVLTIHGDSFRLS